MSSHRRRRKAANPSDETATIFESALCSECKRALSNPRRLARSIRDSTTIYGVLHKDIQGFEAAAKEGCHVCSIIVGSLDHMTRSNSTLDNVSFALGKPDGQDFILRLYDGVSSDALTFRLYPPGEGPYFQKRAKDFGS